MKLFGSFLMFFVELACWCLSLVTTYIIKPLIPFDKKKGLNAIIISAVQAIRKGTDWLLSWINLHQLYRCNTLA